jgi:hypothetical protein
MTFYNFKVLSGVKITLYDQEWKVPRKRLSSVRRMRKWIARKLQVQEQAVQLAYEGERISDDYRKFKGLVAAAAFMGAELKIVYGHTKLSKKK